MLDLLACSHMSQIPNLSIMVPHQFDTLFFFHRHSYDAKYINLYALQVHDVTFAPNDQVVLKETLPVLERAVRDGKARYIGIADYDLELMKEIVDESEIKISSILSYAKSTLLDNRLQNYLTYFKVC